MGDDPSTLERTEEIAGLIRGDITARSRWLTRQATWYQMRHDGIPARNKPWTTASDTHYPLVDTCIAKFTPFYFGQIFGTEVVAQFIALEAELTGMAIETGQFFDYILRQKTDLEPQTLICIDSMLMAGAAPMKVYWDAGKGRLAFDPIQPTHCIVPDQTQGIQDADRVTIVHHFTPESIKREGQFKLKLAEYEAEEEGFLKRITGEGSDADGGNSQLRQTREIREGITHGTAGSNLVIVWEIWEHCEEGWWIHWFSPLAPDKPLRVSQANPFKHGLCPVVLFECEIKEKGYYSSRGVPEKIGMFEQSLSSTWNNKHNAMRLYNCPLFTSTMPIPNSGNLRFTPGQILPGGVQAITMGRPAVSFDEDMMMTRGVAEQLIGVPDYGIGQANDKNDPRTATEVTKIGQQQGTGIELRSRVFLMALRELLKIAWETLCQYSQETLYFIGQQMKTLPSAALQASAWALEPNASSESWDKGAQLQKAITRKQLFGPSAGYPQGAPWINQPELDKSILELDDPRLVARLFMDPNAKLQTEYEDEVSLIPALLMGGPISPKIEQDQGARIKAIVDFIAAQHHLGRPIDPFGAANLQRRIAEHMQLLQQKSPEQAQQVQASIEQQAQNVIPMQPGGGAQQGAPAMPQPHEMPV